MAVWRDVLGYEGVYQVSDSGQVRSIGTRISSRVLRTHTRKRDGYVYVGLRLNCERKTAKVHRLVAEAFLPNPTGLPDVDHINGDRSDNRVSNLRWATKSINGRNRHKTFGEVPLLGVSISSSVRNPYRASICVEGHKQHIGVFNSPEAAHRAYLRAKAGAA